MTTQPRGIPASERSDTLYHDESHPLCSDANDPVGCIFTQNLLVPDATADEINAAVGGAAAGGAAVASSTEAVAAVVTDTAVASATDASSTCPVSLVLWCIDSD